MNLTAEPYGGYALTNLREAGGDETLRFEAVVTRHGRRILHVSNGGTGGSHRYRPVTDDCARFRAALDAFEAFAAEWSRAGEFAGLKDADQLINRLVEVTHLNRMRSVPFVLDDNNYWASGECHRFAGAAAREQVVAILSGPEYKHRNPRIWDKSVGDFVPVDEVVTERIYGEGQ